jgi:serine/threonine protein kinase
MGERKGGGDVRYVLLRQVGGGGMGEVWKAEDTLYGGFWAIKLIKRSTSMDEDFLMESLKKEAKIQVSLCKPDPHPNIVAITDLRHIGEGDIGVVMEYVDGETLQQRMGPRNKPREVNLDEFFAIISQVCAGLHFAHERGVIHRDIKPQNLMINTEAVVKIVDWGVAKNVQAAGSMSYTFAGTGGYMPPEVVRLERMTREERVRSEGVDRRADIYSLGVTMYQLLTREFPFDGQNEVERGVTDKQYLILSKHAKSSLSEIVLKAIAHHPIERYQTARELQVALEDWQSTYLFRGHFESAKAAEAEGDLAGAEQKFRDLLANYPFKGEPYYEAAHFYIRRCREDKAIEVLSAGIERFPDHGPFYETRGRLYAKRNSPKGISDLETALRLLPSGGKGSNQLPIILRRLRANRAVGA